MAPGKADKLWRWPKLVISSSLSSVSQMIESLGKVQDRINIVIGPPGGGKNKGARMYHTRLAGTCDCPFSQSRR